MSEQTVMNKRGCYCTVLREKDPDYFEKQGIPDGFCGVCIKCGKPGHTRHHPGAVPFTGAWCDRHYRVTAWTHPLAFPGGILWLSAIALIGLLISRL